MSWEVGCVYRIKPEFKSMFMMLSQFCKEFSDFLDKNDGAFTVVDVKNGDVHNISISGLCDQDVSSFFEKWNSPCLLGSSLAPFFEIEEVDPKSSIVEIVKYVKRKILW